MKNHTHIRLLTLFFMIIAISACEKSEYVPIVITKTELIIDNPLPLVVDEEIRIYVNQSAHRNQNSVKPVKYIWTIKDSSEQIIQDDFDNNLGHIRWVPEEEGRYTVCIELFYDSTAVKELCKQIIVEPFQDIIHLQGLFLSEYSKNNLPYQNVESIEFFDSLGNETSGKLIRNSPTSELVVVTDTTGIEYHYTKEVEKMTLLFEDLNMKFCHVISSEYLSFDNNVSVDVMELYAINNLTTDTTKIMRFPYDTKDSPNTIIENEFYGEYDILHKYYDSLFTGIQNNKGGDRFLYHLNHGMLRFRDDKDYLWQTTIYDIKQPTLVIFTRDTIVFEYVRLTDIARGTYFGDPIRPRTHHWEIKNSDSAIVFSHESTSSEMEWFPQSAGLFRVNVIALFPDNRRSHVARNWMVLDNQYFIEDVKLEFKNVRYKGEQIEVIAKSQAFRGSHEIQSEKHYWRIKDLDNNILEEDFPTNRSIFWSPPEVGYYKVEVSVEYPGKRIVSTRDSIYIRDSERSLYIGDYHFVKIAYQWTENTGRKSDTTYFDGYVRKDSESEHHVNIKCGDGVMRDGWNETFTALLDYSNQNSIHPHFRIYDGSTSYFYGRFITTDSLEIQAHWGGHGGGTGWSYYGSRIK